MDLVGKLTPTKEGYQYICVMVDYFTKWCEAFPRKTKSAEEINLGVCETLGIKRSLCSPYHPQTNGLIEKLNGTIQKCLSKLVENRPSLWADYLEATMFGLRTKRQITTKFSPYFLLFGREARYPCEVPDTYEINEIVEEMIAEDCVSEGIKRQDRLYQIVQDNMAQVDGKSIDIVDDNGKLFPRINRDHLVHFLEDRPPKAPKVTSPITTTSSPATTFSVPNTTLPTIQPPALTMIYPVTLPVKLSLPNFPCPASFAASQPPASSAAPCADLLRDIWAGKVGGRLWSKIGPYKIFTWDLERLKPGEKLESEMTNLWNGKATKMKKIDLKVYDLLVGSVNEGDHWTLLVIYPQKGKIIYMNSCGESRGKVAQCLKAVRGFMDQNGFEDTTWKCVKLTHSMQPDATSCGVFVCKFAEALLLGGDLNFSCDDTNIAQMREELGLCLLTESEPLGNLCLACGDHYPDTPDLVDTWVACDSCQGWYHWDCVNRPNLKAHYICQGCQGPI
ncbi:hypothetical protein QQF64_018317 [Cirrhinus molitorella]|uniref:Uncharacterized protein n=1 Tax=Cirrhinus molitorella TaxID=172907 RepID=A0ABR3LC88_9TELE